MMEKEKVFQIDLTNPLYKEFAANLPLAKDYTEGKTDEQPKMTVYPPVLYHLLPDKILGHELNDGMKLDLLLDHQIEIGEMYMYRIQLDHANGQLFALDLLEELLWNDKTLKPIQTTNCHFETPRPHAMVINLFDPRLEAYFNPPKGSMIELERQFQKTPYYLAELIPEKVVDYQLTEEERTNLVTTQQLKLKDGQCLKLDVFNGNILIGPTEYLLSDIPNQYFRNLLRSECKFAYDLKGEEMNNDLSKSVKHNRNKDQGLAL